MSDLADFLLARIEEDEVAARLATRGGPDWRAESRDVSDLAAGTTIAEATDPESATRIAPQRTPFGLGSPRDDH
jgi:Family of unknown function (DUF6221)